MPNGRAKIRKEPGKFTHLSPERISDIKNAALAAVRANNGGNTQIYESLIDSANESLTKYEKGLFNGFALSAVHNG